MAHFVVLILVVLGMDVLYASGKSFHYLESAQKFGENNLCKTQDQRQMLQKALIGKVCSSSDKQRNKGFNNDDFMLYVVHTLCKDTGGWLADWVLKNVDTDEDGRVSHFEENMFYNNN
ncbi:uncharacterized protein LOC128245543 [Mya arenaria]|uniref:uncharacterized protein LOC128245543 n=1 Tax=Mya arenaria TaxID=6604 RepID=UPI0022E59A7E|nr:uncharacterized protein LOC128245543 [Mya arenaria]XP_052819704.1 uncharacterized protein LOC128245543 [Mya arenaria]XP_052819705.1 uncharacterized protein LOC128245543 [Mya arenaria]